jgi:hypothetical protein
LRVCAEFDAIKQRNSSKSSAERLRRGCKIRSKQMKDWCGQATRIDKSERNKSAGNAGRNFLAFV